MRRLSGLGTTPERSRLMARVRRTGTGPELALRRALRRKGLPYRAGVGRSLPGSPDVAFKRHRVAVFVDGCFWHGCPRHGTIPRTNTVFWLTKILTNRRRDRRVTRALRLSGWRVVRVWEHDIRANADKVASRIERQLGHHANGLTGPGSAHHSDACRALPSESPVGSAE